MPDDKPKPTSIRLEPDVRDYVEQISADENRSISNTINTLIRRERSHREDTK